MVALARPIKLDTLNEMGHFKMSDKLDKPDLGIFFISDLNLSDGSLSIKISSNSKVENIVFASHEAFQFFHESDYHPIQEEYKMSAIGSIHEGDCGLFQIEKSPFYDLFQRSNGRYLDEMPSCFLVSTADERLEVITFDQPSFSFNSPD